MEVHVVIVTYNSARWIDWCLSSLRDGTHPSTPVVIDNGSTDDTLAIIKDRHTEAVVFPQDHNLGFGQANNIGIRYALEHGADAVLLLNSDAALAPDALERLVAESDGESLLTPLHFNGSGERLDYVFKRWTVCKQDNTMIDDTLRGTLAPSYPIDHVCAACWFLPANLLRKIGGFNPLFFHYGEDDNYICRLHYHRIPMYIVPKSHMYHCREKYGNESLFRIKWLYRNLLLIATDIRQSFWARQRRYVWLLLRCYAIELPKHHYCPGTFLTNTIRVALLGRKLKKSRNAEKQLNGAWL